MKLNKVLFVNGKRVKLQSEQIRLSLQSPGRAILQVVSDVPLEGLVRLEMGYSTQKQSQVYFIGAIRASETVDSDQQRLRCRELTSVLYATLPAALRHPTLNDVAQWYADNTGLRFIVPERDYADKRVPAFYTLGDGFHGLNSLGKVFGIENYIWQQQGDGSVFVGSWNDSRWATKPVELKERLFYKVTATGSKKSAVLPQIRPGVMLNGRYVVGVEIEGHEMVTTCSKTL